MTERCPDGRCRAPELEGRVGERQRYVERQAARLRAVLEDLEAARYLVRRLWQVAPETTVADVELRAEVERLMGDER